VSLKSLISQNKRAGHEMVGTIDY